MNGIRGTPETVTDKSGLVATLQGHTSWVAAVAVTPDGRRAISVSADKTLKVWELQSGREPPSARRSAISQPSGYLDHLTTLETEARQSSGQTVPPWSLVQPRTR
jgi:WD40 repeat protein